MRILRSMFCTNRSFRAQIYTYLIICKIHISNIINYNISLNTNKSMEIFFFCFSKIKKKNLSSRCLTDRLNWSEPTDYFSSTSYVSLFTAESISKQILFQHWRETTRGSMSRSLRVLSLLVGATKHVCISDIQ